ncbi:hypothetical protein [Vulcanococcus limneticus]|uniref:hypothetical protein n=1 Tax=Vulcanococcus limneticus TaxID=2170428 RepID=UPI00398BEAE1
MTYLPADLKAQTSPAFDLSLLDFDAINSAANPVPLYKAINWKNATFSELLYGNDSINWSLVNLTAAASSSTFSIQYVDWQEVNSSSTATKAYASFAWSSVDWSSVDSVTRADLDWGRINLMKASAGASFDINIVDWQEVNSARTATKAYASFAWSSVDWSSVASVTRADLDWGKINLKKASAGANFDVNVVDWQEVNQSSIATSAYQAIAWDAIDYGSLDPGTVGAIEWSRLTQDQQKTAEGGLGQDLNGDGLVAGSQAFRFQPLPVSSQLETTFLFSSTQSSSSQSYSDVDGYYTSQFNKDSQYAYHLDNASRPSIVKQTASVSISGSFTGGVTFENPEVNYYYYSYRPGGISIAMFSGSDAEGTLYPVTDVRLLSVVSFASLPDGGYALESIQGLSEGGVRYGGIELFERGGYAGSFEYDLGVIYTPTESNLALALSNRDLYSVIKSSETNASRQISYQSIASSLYNVSVDVNASPASIGINYKIYNTPYADMASYDATGDIYSGGFGTVSQWLRSDLLLTGNSPYELSVGAPVFSGLFQGSVPGFDPSVVAWRSRQSSSFSNDAGGSSEQTGQVVTDPLTGLVVSATNTYSDSYDEFGASSPSSYSSTETITADYVDGVDAAAMLSYDPALEAAMQSQLATAAAGFGEWSSDQPTLLSTFWEAPL